MTGFQDPYRFHPELRSKITDPQTSFFRNFTTAVLEEKASEYNIPNWWFSDETREALRTEALSAHRDKDLWVFAYGSLMWDPAFEFAEVRRANAPNHARRFILKDIYGARGTLEAPGLMAALDLGPGCEGLVFKIARDRIETETEILWQREQVGPAYKAVFIETTVGETIIPALTFVADPQAELIDTSITRQEQIRFAATGTGFVGTSLEYLENIRNKFHILGIHDDEVEALYRDVVAYSAGT